MNKQYQSYRAYAPPRLVARRNCRLWMCLLGAWVAGIPQAYAADEYLLNAGDTIRIYVYGEPELTFDEALIGQNGRIAFPFVGTLAVAGRTINQVQNELINGLQPDYLIDPRVSVDIVKYRQFYINGEVKNPGGIDFQPGLTLLKAISLAGGFTERANKKNITVVSDTDGFGEERKIKENYVVQPGDIFTVNDAFF